MISCLKCNGTLKYDIVSRLLVCESCNSHFAPEDADIAGAEESKEFDATVYNCPRCGGEVISLNNQVVSNCSYCGEQVQLTSRMMKIEKPKAIVPFEVTKDRCIKTFKERMNKAPCVPDDFKSQGNLDGFRAIYMPHWVYKGEQKGDVSYIVHEPPKKNSASYYYYVNGAVDLTYEGMAHDASSSFPDSMSELLAPYNMSKMVDFAPGYYAGFYADAADVAAEVYEYEAESAMINETKDLLTKMSDTKGMIENYSSDLWKDVVHSEIKESYIAMLPVWFMTYRSKDRVSYITMNGQTGRMAFDIPVSKPKFLLLSAVFGVFASFFLFIFKLTNPPLCTFFLAFFAMWMVLRHRKSIELITKKKGVMSDWGENYAKVKQAKERNKKLREAAKRAGMEDLHEDVYVTAETNYSSREAYIREKEAISKRRDKRKGLVISGALVILYAVSQVFSVLMSLIGGKIVGFMVAAAIVIVGIWMGVENVIRLTETEETGNIMKGGFSVLSIIICGVMIGWFPEDYTFFAIANVLSLGLITITAIDIIDKHNRLGTRKIPHFEYSKFK